MKNVYLAIDYYCICISNNIITSKQLVWDFFVYVMLVQRMNGGEWA